MNEHLRDGCAECLDTYALWMRLVTFAEQERSLDVPEPSVRVAKSYFNVLGERKPDSREGNWLTALVATLTFDSRQQPLLAGVRAGGVAAAHLLYSAGEFAIDLHVEPGGRPDRMLMAGQIADATRADLPLRDVQITISDGPTELVAVPANEFGEFQCEFDMRPDLMLVVSVKNRNRIAISLDIILESAGSPAAEHSDNR